MAITAQKPIKLLGAGLLFVFFLAGRVGGGEGAGAAGLGPAPLAVSASGGGADSSPSAVAAPTRTGGETARKAEEVAPAAGTNPRLTRLELVGAKIQDVYRLLGRMAGVNIVVDPRLEGEVTLSLQDLSLREALDYLTRLYGHAYKEVGKTIVITTPENLATNWEERQVRAFPVKYAALAEAKAALALVVKPEQVTVQSEGKLLLVKGTPAELLAAEATLAALDVPPRQVFFQVRLEEVSDEGLTELGLKWQFPTLMVEAKNFEGKTVVGVGYEPVLSALENEGKARLLERVSLVAQDGREASTLIGERIPLVTRKVIEGKSEETVEFLEVGVKLYLKPEIKGDGQITVNVRPEVSALAGVSAQDYPVVHTRETQTTLTLKDGETMVLSGLRQREEITSWTKVPFLGKIPLLGLLFRHKNVRIKESEIMVFITAQLDRGQRSFLEEENRGILKTSP